MMGTCYPLCKNTPQRHTGAKSAPNKCEITNGGCLFWGQGQMKCDFYKPITNKGADERAYTAE